MCVWWGWVGGQIRSPWGVSAGGGALIPQGGKGLYPPLHKEPWAAEGCACIPKGSQRFDPNLDIFWRS